MRLDNIFPRETDNAKASNTPLVIVGGTVEYHGPHCSFGCDTLIAKGLVERLAEKKELIIASAGPLFNALMAFLIKDGPLYDINMAMAIINLFPVMPLDGGRMVYALLSLAKGSFFAMSFMRRLSFSGGVLLTALGVYQAIFTGFNLSVFTAGTFLLFSAICENGKERLYMGGFLCPTSTALIGHISILSCPVCCCPFGPAPASIPHSNAIPSSCLPAASPAVMLPSVFWRLTAFTMSGWNELPAISPTILTPGPM